MFSQIIVALILGALCLFLFRAIRRQPAATFSRDNMQKSFRTAGVLSLILIGFVALLVWFVRGG